MPTTTVAAHQHVDDVLAATENHPAPDNDLLQNSWRRSANAYRLDPASDRRPQLLTTHELHDSRAPAGQLLRSAQVELDYLYKLVRPARYVILLCDTNGVVIDHRGEETEAQQFRYWGTWLGGVWAENVEGTNGIGTCIAEQNAVTVHRSQHFRARHMTLSCSGAPIFGVDGALAGVLDVSSIDPELSEHAHALTGALVTASARAVDERLFRAAFSRDWILVVRIPDNLGSTMIIAVDHDQRIVAAGRTGRAALAQLGHPLDKDGLALSAVFERNDALFRKEEGDDLWAQIKPHHAAEPWPVIVTPPESNARHMLPEAIDLHLRPRRDMLLSSRWTSPEPLAQRGGLAPAALRRVRQYIDANLDRTIDLESLATAAGLSRFHFARSFKQSEGMTPHSYVLERRIAKARELLRQRDLSLSEIASNLGFSDQSHFTRHFRAVTGVSPGQFRKSQG